MTRLEAGSIKPKAEFVDIADIIGSALRRAEKLVEGYRIEIDLAENLPMVRLDPVLLEQVLFNLLDNAAKYAPSGSEIRIRGEAADNRVALSVADEGDGVPDADLERIFDKFYRVNAGDRQHAGTGLGLAICRGFIEAMGGTIAAANRRDRRGAVFTITMPNPTPTFVPGEKVA